jgi:hypothetical protein
MDERLSSLTEDDLAAFRNSQRAAKRKKTNSRDGWLGRCLADDRGRIIPNLANTMIALRSDPTLSGAIAFDEMQQDAILVERLPVAPSGKTAGLDLVPRPVRDEDVSQLQE